MIFESKDLWIRGLPTSPILTYFESSPPSHSMHNLFLLGLILPSVLYSCSSLPYLGLLWFIVFLSYEKISSVLAFTYQFSADIA